MSAFVECFLCDARITTRDDFQTDEQIADEFREKGWTVGPTRCPEHVGIVSAPPASECELDHDPAPMLQSGMAASCQSIWMGKARFAPTAGTCRWYEHYYPAAAAA